MKYCKPELSFFIFTSYERSECFIFGVKRKMLHNEVASSEKASFLWSTPVGVWSILRHCRKIWSTADAVWSKAFSGFMFFCLDSRQKKWRRFFLSPPTILKRFLSLKTQNFAVKWNSENHFTFIQKNSEYRQKNKKHLHWMSAIQLSGTSSRKHAKLCILQLVVRIKNF